MGEESCTKDIGTPMWTVKGEGKVQTRRRHASKGQVRKIERGRKVPMIGQMGKSRKDGGMDGSPQQCVRGKKAEESEE